jgi:hypothetical protein
MTDDASHSHWPGHIAVGVVRTDPPEVFLAADDIVLSRVLALFVVAPTDPRSLSVGALADIREALLDERWADAVVRWIDATGEPVDGYPDERVWTADSLDLERASMEIRVSRIFNDPPAE